MKSSGFSLLEVLGGVAIVLTLAVVAIPSTKGFSEGGKQGAVVRNASALNSAKRCYGQPNVPFLSLGISMLDACVA